MEQYLYISFKCSDIDFSGWYRDPKEQAGLGDLVYAPLITKTVLGEVVLVHRMTKEEARFFYPARIKSIVDICETYDERPGYEKKERAPYYQKTRERFERYPKSFAFRV